MRAAIVASASTLFATVGYESTTMAEVAAKAGTSIGNVYKYFSNKESLFDEVLPRSFASDVRRLTKKRVESVGISTEAIDLCIQHRERVVILLSKAEGTHFHAFAAELSKSLVGWALEYLKRDVDEVFRFALRRIYDAFIESMARIFSAFHDETRIRQAVDLVTTHHLGGLRALFEAA